MQITNLIQQLPWHPTRRWSSRELSRVNKIILHQELGDSSIEEVNNYHINPNHISSNGCPHFCYHYGIRKSGEIIQANELSSIVWHCSGENSVSIGIMFEGNFKGPGHDLAAEGPADEQMISVDWLVKYLIRTFGLTNQDLFGHYHFGKPACPGYAVQDWIEGFRNDISAIKTRRKIEKTVKEIQKRLNKLGYAVGEVDGIIGVNTRKGICKFQEDNQLVVDGIAGPQTWSKLLLLTEKI